jgi:hypothetical protein
MSRRPKLTGRMLRDWVRWLQERKCGCCHLEVAQTENNIVSICAGYRDLSDNDWNICAMVAFQSRNNVCQCDYDIDFTMPWVPETGDVVDTEERICKEDDKLPSLRECSEIAKRLNSAVTMIKKSVIDLERLNAA